MFTIEFISEDQPSVPQRARRGPGMKSREGRIVVGAFAERFESPTDFWSHRHYEAQWVTAARRLIAGAPRSAFITSMYDPAKANFLTWWPAYREGADVFVQNQLLLLDRLPRTFDVAAIEDFVRARETISDEGRKISEWVVGICDLEEFLGRPSL